MDNADRLDGYFDIVHEGMVNFVPPHARRLLSIGCATGGTEAYLKARFGLEQVVGVEFEPEIARQAETALDAVHAGDIEVLTLPYPPEHFDMILCLDVLEHVRDPWAVLQEKLLPLLGPGGVVVISVPNIRYWMVIWRLFWGQWGYARRGILDIGHLRFFTPATAHHMLRDAGLTDIEIRRKYRLYDSLGDRPSSRIISGIARRMMPVLLRLRIFDVLFPLRDFFTFQIVLVGRKT